MLIVAADIASCALDWADLGASAIFGDGAAAAVIARERDPDATTPGILASAFATYSEGAHLCEIRAGGSRHHPSRCDANGAVRRAEDYLTLAQFRMDGQAVFHLVARHLDEFIDALLRGAGSSATT